MVDQVGDYTGDDHDQSEQERAHAEHNLVFAADDGKSQQQDWRNADGNRSKHAAGHAERALQFRFANAQADQGHKFERETRAVNHDVERDQALEAKIQREAPANRQRQNRNPGCALFLMQLAKDFRQHAILRHGQRQPRVAHDQRIEHAEAAQHAARHQRDPKHRSTH